jgi:uncharacterized repeat protein (TIGR02543 family)
MKDLKELLNKTLTPKQTIGILSFIGLFMFVTVFASNSISTTNTNTQTASVSTALNQAKVGNMVQSTTQTCTSATKNGVTWTFDKSYTCGQYVNGDWWVVGPIKITDISPKPIVGRNGSILYPQAMDLVGTLNQAFDDRIWSTPYVDSYNIGKNISITSPLSISGQSSLVSTVSNTTDSAPAVGETIEAFAILTVLDSAAPNGSFRPTYFGGEYNHPYKESNLNYNALGKFDKTKLSSIPSMSASVDRFDKTWYEQGTHSFTRLLHARYMGLRGYGKDMAIQTGDAGILLNLNYSDAEKRDLLVRIVQYGIDINGGLSNGLTWYNDGGHNMGRMMPFMIAAMTLNNGDMKAKLSEVGNFHETHSTFYVTQKDVDTSRYQANWYPDILPPDVGCTLTEKSGTVVVGCPRKILPYKQADIGMPEWRVNYNENWAGNNWDAYYRDVVGSVLPVLASVSKLMGTESLINHPALFDYAKRHIYYSANRFTQSQYYNGYDNGDAYGFADGGRYGGNYPTGHTLYASPFAYNPITSTHRDFYFAVEGATPININQYYVSPTGAGTKDGKSISNATTLANVATLSASKLNEEITFNFVDGTYGTYTDTALRTKKHTWKAINKHGPKFTVLNLNGDNLNVDGFSVINDGSGTTGMQISGSNNEVSNSIINNNSRHWAVSSSVVVNASGNIVRDSEILNAGRVLSLNGRNIQILRNKIHGSTSSLVQSRGADGLLFEGNHLWDSEHLIAQDAYCVSGTGPKIDWPCEYSTATPHENLFSIRFPQQGLVIRGNFFEGNGSPVPTIRIRDGEDASVTVTTDNPIIIENNVITELKAYTGNIFLKNNYISFADFGICSGVHGGKSTLSQVTGNIIGRYGVKGSCSSTYGTAITDQSNVIQAYNVIGRNIEYAKIAATDVMLNGDWDMPHPTESYLVNFGSSVFEDYQLKANTLPINFVKQYAPTTDALGKSRVGDADAGPFEYQGTISNTYTLTTNATNGTITKSPNQTSYTSGTSVTLTAQPNGGYTFTGWVGCTPLTTDPNKCTVTMDANKSVTANFTAVPVNPVTLYSSSQVLNLDGTQTQEISVDDSKITNAITVSARIKRSSDVNQYPGIVSDEDYPGNKGYYLGDLSSTTNSPVCFRINGSAGYAYRACESSAQLNSSEYIHYVGVFDGSTKKVSLYRDGVLVSQTTHTASSIATDTGIEEIGWNFKGSIKDVVILNYAVGPNAPELNPEPVIPTTPVITTPLNNTIFPSNTTNVAVSWTGDATNYMIRYITTNNSTGVSTTNTANTTNKTYSVPVTQGNSYQFYVAAGTETNKSPETNVNFSVEKQVSQTYTLTATTTGTGSGTITGNLTEYNEGDIAILTATPDANSTVTWSSGCSAVSNNVCTVNMTGNITVTVRFELIPPQTYAISYNGNGNTAGAVPASQTKTENINLTLATQGTLAKTGYTFAGWNTNALGTGTNYAAGASYTANASATMYAKWTQINDPLPSKDKLVSITGPSTVEIGKTYDITVKYDAKAERYLTLDFKIPSSTTYVSLKQLVPAGIGKTYTFQLTIPSETSTTARLEYLSYLSTTGLWTTRTAYSLKSGIRATGGSIVVPIDSNLIYSSTQTYNHNGFQTQEIAVDDSKITNALTVSAKVMRNTSTSTYIGLIKDEDYTGNKGYYLGDLYGGTINNSPICFRINGKSGDGAIVCEPSAVLSTSAYTHYVGVFDGVTKTVKLYRDGVQVASKVHPSSSISLDSGVEEIGDGLKGSIKDIQIFNKVLNGSLQ